MSSMRVVWLGGGLTSATAGLLLVSGHLFNLGGGDYSTVLGGSSVLAAHLLLVFGLVAIYAVQAEHSDSIGLLGMLLGVMGTTLVSGVVLVEIAGASGAEVGAVLASGVSGALSVLGGLAFFVGLLLFAVAGMRAGVFSRWAGALLIVGDVVFSASGFSGHAAPVVEVVGAAITCAGFVWLGLALTLQSRSSFAVGQPSYEEEA